MDTDIILSVRRFKQDSICKGLKKLIQDAVSLHSTNLWLLLGSEVAPREPLAFYLSQLRGVQMLGMLLNILQSKAGLYDKELFVSKHQFLSPFGK
jgi:hypothetical protein